MAINFGIEGNQSSNNTTPETNPETTIQSSLVPPTEDIENNDDEKSDESKTNVEDKTDKESNSNETHDIPVGTEIEFDGNTYSVAENGDIIDSEGNVFKEAKDVKSWVDSLDKEADTESNFDIKELQKAIGIDITDNNGNVLEFENSIEGVNNYVKQVIESSKEEHYQTALDTLFNAYPILEEVLAYYQANGNSLDGFNVQTDRSQIEIDENNEEQQESIIKMAYKEKGIKGDVDGYIAYLKSTGNLYKTAQDELESLKEKDFEAKEALKRQAEEAEKQRAEELASYWGSVKNIVDSGKVAGYEIPTTITINRDGKKLAVNRNDFFNYIYRVDKYGKSQYAYDLEKDSPEERINDDILRAFLKFSGGTYSDLVKIAENKKEVERLRLVAKNNKTTSIRFKTPEKKNTSGKVDFGV